MLNKVNLSSRFQTRPALTRNGNEYKPTRFGLYTGIAAGTLSATKVLTSRNIVDVATRLFTDCFNAKGLKNTITAAAKCTKFWALAGLGTALTIALAGCIGNSLIDAPMNQELRDQADGEAVKKSK